AVFSTSNARVSFCSSRAFLRASDAEKTVFRVELEASWSRNSARVMKQKIDEEILADSCTTQNYLL
ncbi:MAG: hypothetical protein FWC27_07050, partial [Firmicutes bacterium]|nr:hypothetical protein [Bacillota bacterium]